MNTTTKVITGFIVGVAAGAAAGLLLAPQSGATMRRRLSSDSEKLIDSLTGNVKDSVEEAINAIRSAYNSKAEDLSRTAKETARGARKALNKVNV